MLMVAYPGNAQALAALDRNEIKKAFDFTSSSGAWVKEGKLHVLAITSKDRNPGDFKDAPPIGETVRGFELVGWQGVMVPRDTPRDIIMDLNAALNKVLQENEIVAFIRNGNLELAGGARRLLATASSATMKCMAGLLGRQRSNRNEASNMLLNLK